VRGSGWGDRVARVWRWRPSTYRQVWIFAVLGLGMPGLIIWAVEEQQHSLIYAVSITFFSGLGQSWQLNRRRQRLDELKNLYPPPLRFPAVPPIADDK
jgi:hypothetical protein